MKMKNSKIVVLLAALPAAILAANVQAAPELYGKLNVSVQKNDAETDLLGDTLDNWTVDSNASRFGIKGAIDLNDKLKGIYKIEFEVFVDDGNDATTGDVLKQRNIYAGLQNNWGTLIGGKFDTPTKEAQGKVDQFNDYNLADISNVIVGETRANNIGMYSSPKIAGIVFNAAFMPGEETGVAAGQHDNGLADALSASAVYDSDKLYLAASVDNHVVSAWGAPIGVSVETDILRLVGQIKLEALSLGVILQRAEDSSQAGVEKQDGVILSAAFTMNKETFKAQVGHSERDVSDVEKDSISLGWDHSLSKDAKAYVYVSDLETTNVAGVSGDDGSETTAGLGFELKF